jgi:arsenite-transporting ATPase
MILSFVVIAAFLVMTSSFRLLSPRGYSSLISRLPHFSRIANGISKTRKSSFLSDIVFSRKDKSLVKGPKEPQFIFVGGKGGVGKTTASSSIALTCSDNELPTLVVSTDPAHSLGDCFDLDLSSGKVIKIPTENNLWGLEIDINEAMQSFQSILSMNPATLASQANIPKEMLDIVDLEELLKIFRNPPPGMDEIFALTKIFQFTEESQQSQQRFSRIIIDTAPTGHTLRLLQLPTFLSKTALKILKLRAQVNQMMGMMSMFFSRGGNNESAKQSTQQVIKMFERVEQLQSSIQRLANIIKDHEQTQFVVVTIPTTVAFEETKRLISNLSKNDIRISSLICNQVLTEHANEGYLKERAHYQQYWINSMKTFLEDRTLPVEMTKVPYLSQEITTIYGLKYFVDIAHPIDETEYSARNPKDSRKLTIFGGKGGVG